MIWSRTSMARLYQRQSHHLTESSWMKAGSAGLDSPALAAMDARFKLVHTDFNQWCQVPDHRIPLSHDKAPYQSRAPNNWPSLRRLLSWLNVLCTLRVTRSMWSSTSPADGKKMLYLELQVVYFNECCPALPCHLLSRHPRSAPSLLLVKQEK